MRARILLLSLLLSFLNAKELNVLPLNLGFDSKSRVFFSTAFLKLDDKDEDLYRKARLINFELGYNKRLFLNEFSLVDYFSYTDFFGFSSLLNLSLTKSNLYKKEGTSYSKSLNESFKTSPDLSFGLGFSAGTKPFHFYAMPVLGYRYDYKDNAFAAARLGFILDFERLGFELDFSKYFDKVNNRGYDLELSNTAKFKLFKHSFFYIKHKFYSNESTKIYPQKELNLITLGFELSLLDI